MGIATNVLGILKLATGAARIGRGGSTVDADLETLENGQTTLNDTLTAEAGKVATLQRQVVPLARAVRILIDGGSGQRGPTILYDENSVFPNSDFSIVIEGVAINWESTDKQYIAGRQDVAGINGCNIVYVGKKLRIEARDTGTGANTVIAQSTAEVSVTEFYPLNVCFSVSLNGDGSASALWIVDGVQLGDSVPITSEYMSFIWSGPGHWKLFSQYGIVANRGEFQRVIFYNRALSSQEALKLAINGPSPADIGAPGNRASQVAAISTDFSSGFDIFTTGNATTRTGGNSVGGEDNFYLAENTSASTAHYSRAPISSAIPVGSRVKIRGKYYVPSTNTDLDGFRIYNDDNNDQLVMAINSAVVDTITEFETDEFILTESSIRFWHTDGGSIFFTNAGDKLYLKDIEFIVLGITGLWSAEHAQSDTGQVFDQIHGNHALLPPAGATIHPQPEGLRQVRSTLTWSGDSSAKYLGSNQDILPEGAEIERVTAVIEGTPVDGTLGDPSDPDRYCTLAQNTGLIEGSNRLALSERTTDGANRELLWTPSAAFNGTIKFTIHYFVGEQ